MIIPKSIIKKLPEDIFAPFKESEIKEDDFIFAVEENISPHPATCRLVRNKNLDNPRGS
ncbi:MAG: hypothetical protein GX023_02920 [Tissierellia bacterium]|nr:hypothetical protein [Tissierellia bacterium]